MDLVYEKGGQLGRKGLRAYGTYKGWSKRDLDVVEGAADQFFGKRQKLDKKFFKVRKSNFDKTEKSGKTSLKQLQPMPKFKASRYSKALKYKKKVPKYKKKTYTKAKKAVKRLDKEIRRVVKKTIDPKYEVGTFRYSSMYPLRYVAVDTWATSINAGGQGQYFGGPQRVADAEAILFNGKSVTSTSWNTKTGDFPFNHKVVLRSINQMIRITNDSQLRFEFEIYEFYPKKPGTVDPLTLWNNIYNEIAAGTHTGTSALATAGDYNAFHSDSEVLQTYFTCKKKVYDLMPGSQRKHNIFLKGKLIDWTKIVTANVSPTDPTSAVFPTWDNKVPSCHVLYRYRPWAHSTTLASVQAPAETGTGGCIAVETMTTIKVQCPEIAPAAANVVTFTSYNDFPAGAIGSANMIEEDNPATQVAGPV